MSISASDAATDLSSEESFEGQLVGGKYRVGVGWRRDFAAGTVIINPSGSESQTFALGGAYTTADGSTVSTVTLGPAQALVLRGNGVADVPASTALPVVSGTAQVGNVLTASTGSIFSGSSRALAPSRGRPSAYSDLPSPTPCAQEIVGAKCAPIISAQSVE